MPGLLIDQEIQGATFFIGPLVEGSYGDTINPLFILDTLVETPVVLELQASPISEVISEV